jgi:DNA-binding NtrC family response regulator
MSGASFLSNRRILIVEDEVMVAWALEEMLTSLGCVVVGPAARVNQALAMIDAEVFDAVLLDVNLNGEKSYPVADVLAARGLRFVFSSGYQRSALPDVYQTFPMLQKPFSGTDLFNTLTELFMHDALRIEGDIIGGGLTLAPHSVPRLT